MNYETLNISDFKKHVKISVCELFLTQFTPKKTKVPGDGKRLSELVAGHPSTQQHERAVAEPESEPVSPELPEPKPGQGSGPEPTPRGVLPGSVPRLKYPDATVPRGPGGGWIHRVGIIRMQ